MDQTDNKSTLAPPAPAIDDAPIVDEQVDYVTKDDLKMALGQLNDSFQKQNKATNKRLEMFERRMESLIAGAGFVRQEEMREEITATLGDYPTISETKAMVDATRSVVFEEIRPIELHLKMIGEQLAKIVALDGTVQSLVRDVGRLSAGHDEQQNDLSRLTADQHTITKNLGAITNTLIGVDGSGGVLAMSRLNASKLESFAPMIPKMTAVDAWVADQREKERLAVLKRVERIQFVKGLPRSKKLWGAIGTGILTACAELVRQFIIL